MTGNSNSGRRPQGPTFEIRVRIPKKFEPGFNELAKECGFSKNQTAKLLLLEALKANQY